MITLPVHPGAWEVVDRVPLDHDGKTGSRLERVTTSDGRVLIVKEENPATTWVMQATGDDGRLPRLWSSGTLAHLPAEVDSTIETVVTIPTGWRVVMRDATGDLFPDGGPITRAQSRRLLAAAASVHKAFRSPAISGMCSLADRLALLTPAVVRPMSNHPLRHPILDGWDRFFELIPGHLRQPLLSLVEQPGILAAELGKFPAVLLHGDLKLANLGINSRRVVMLDWGTMTGPGPPAVDFAWYLAINGASIGASLDEQLDDVTSMLAPEDRAAIPLALLGALVQLGWEKSLRAGSSDPATARRERSGLGWWSARATEALEEWSPA
jgi:hypothetical protein